MLEHSAPHQPVQHLAKHASTLAHMFAQQVERIPDRAAFYTKDGAWTPTTWRQFEDRALRVAHGLVEVGVQPGDRVAILGPTRPEWAYQDMGAQIAGAVSLGIYPKQSVEQVRYILEHSEARVLFVADAKELATVLEAARGVETLTAIVPWDAGLLGGQDQRLVSPAAFEAEALDGVLRVERQSLRAPDDTAIFVYTSGTTGPPKCAMISHANILAVLSSQASLGAFYEDDIALSFLPMAHVAERVLAFYGRTSTGISTAYATSIPAVLDELKEVRPTVFGSVPRIFEKAYAKIRTELAKKPPVAQKIFAWAEKVGRARIRALLAGKSVPFGTGLQFKLADKLVFSKIRDAFGGRVRLFITGAAPTPMEVLEFFWAAGLPIYEVYGQTEATVVTHANREGHTRLGTVGQLLPGIEQRVAPDGEIQIKGPFVFQGYFKDPNATAATIVDGWLNTGDIGTIDEQGYLRITDRKKHIIITAGGKNLTPANIESTLKVVDPLIGFVHAHGDKRKYVSALVVPSPVETLQFGVDRGVVSKDELDARTKELMENPTARTEALALAMAPVTEHPEFVARIRKAIAKGNKGLSQVEKVKRFAILNRDFSQEGNELTPTMKVRRKNVEELYEATFDRLYAEEDFGHTPG